MKKLIILACVAIVGVVATGCGSIREQYKASPLTPDGFNYTYAGNHSDGLAPRNAQHYFGFSWSLKD